MTKLIRRALLGASAIAVTTLAASPAAAQNVDRIVAFGDSYADTGIGRTTIITDPLANPTFKAIVGQSYPTGRFSGGTNYIDSLATILDVPVVNYAVGGALTNPFPNGANNTNCSPPGGPASPAMCPLGFGYEIDQFSDFVAGNPLFPAALTTFEPTDLVTISIGGNDARYYQQFFSAAPMAPFIAESIAGATAGLDRLVAAGAPTISFLAGDTSRLPEVLTDASARTIRSAYSGAFNAGVQTTLAGYAADGVMVHYLDLNLVLDNILANPAAYGITQGSAASLYTCPVPTLANPGCLVDSTGYLFYFDGLHLTSGAFAIVAQYVATQLTAPLTLEAPSDIALDTAHQFGRTLSGRMNFASFGEANHGLKAYLIGDMFGRRVNASDATDEFAISGHGGTAGVEYGFGGGVIGVAANLSKSKSEFGNDAARTKSESLQLGGYAAMGFGGGFAQGYVGYGDDNHDIRRTGVLDPMTADADGHHWIAGAKLGYLMPFGGVQIGPVAALDYAKASIGDYTEEGDAALTLNVSGITAKSLRGSLGAEMRGNIDMGGLPLRPYGALVLEKELSDGSRTISFAQTSAPGIVNSWAFDDNSKRAYGRLSGGISAGVFGNVSLDGALSMTFGKKDGNDTSAHVGVKVGF
jgi:outer membrane lipase/esterase